MASRITGATKGGRHSKVSSLKMISRKNANIMKCNGALVVHKLWLQT